MEIVDLIDGRPGDIGVDALADLALAVDIAAALAAA
jgi:hypothetical protein